MSLYIEIVQTYTYAYSKNVLPIMIFLVFGFLLPD